MLKYAEDLDVSQAHSVGPSHHHMGTALSWQLVVMYSMGLDTTAYPHGGFVARIACSLGRGMGLCIFPRGNARSRQ